MKWFIVLVVFIHAFIHLLGFYKSFNLLEIKSISMPVSKIAGILWLFTAILLITYAILYFLNKEYALILGISAILLSQYLIISSWKDAKFGSLANLVILFSIITLFSSCKFQQKVSAETLEILNYPNTPEIKNIDQKDISELPVSVQNWFKCTGILDKEYIYAGEIFQSAKLKMNPKQKKWINATALQYTNIEKPAFIWTINAKMNYILKFKGRDKFQNGQGEMLIKINSLINVVNEKGEKLNEGTIQRFLGEMVWFPNLALSKYITWKEINDTTALATMEYMGTIGSGTFYFNKNGDVIKYSAYRYYGNNPESEKYLWEMKILDYKSFDGIKIPSKMTATWFFPDDEWTWLNLEIINVNYNNNITFKN